MASGVSLKSCENTAAIGPTSICSIPHGSDHRSRGRTHRAPPSSPSRACVARGAVDVLAVRRRRATGVDEGALLGRHDADEPVRGHVGDLRVVPVEEVVDRELPVARDHELLDAGHDLEVAAQHHEVDREPRRRPEVVVERRRGRVHRCEDEALVRVELRDLAEPVLGAVELVVVQLRHPGDADEAAVEAIGPPVVGAHEDLGVALLGAADRVATMSAGVEEALDAAVLLAHDEHVVAPDRRSKKSPAFGIWRLVAQELPRPAEDQLHLLLEDVRVAEDPSIDLARARSRRACRRRRGSMTSCTSSSRSKVRRGPGRMENGGSVDGTASLPLSDIRVVDLTIAQGRAPVRAPARRLGRRRRARRAAGRSLPARGGSDARNLHRNKRTVDARPEGRRRGSRACYGSPIAPTSSSRTCVPR